ncbi:MAG: hypothetical protein KF708_23365 [Pirellulales bacterium]|nr:hypothetical protein [Pirellulales bacterium]
MRGAALWIVALSLVPACLGCGSGAQPVEAAVQNPPATPPPAASTPSGEARHPVVRALLQALHGVEAEEADLRSVRQSLLDADDDLVRASGANLREAILRANQKPPVLMVHPDYQEPVPGAPEGAEVPETPEAPVEDPAPAGDATPSPPAVESDPFGSP